MTCPCCEGEMDVADTVVKTVTRALVSTVWRCPSCTEESPGFSTCECEGYYSEDARGNLEIGDSRRWLC